ncbi:NUDIX domain-containing protein [Rhodohalobacter halophilus]|uniref:NUDIX domain-containing protein n=1 Tax=Rhodohalobacter halophilus TaxID=1812810 RepID=UPI00083F580C|nr:NUDIX pyrophosphatase [Rhodohalobacter halophilus]
MSKKRLIDLYAYRIINGGVEFLLFKRAKGKIYEGQWRMIGGKVHPEETYWQGALRELKEETGLTPVTFWTLPSVNTFYEHNSDTVHQIPAFAAELQPDSLPNLDDEHTEYRWFTLKEATEQVTWPEQQRLLGLAHRLITENKILKDWHVSIPSS